MDKNTKILISIFIGLIILAIILVVFFVGPKILKQREERLRQQEETRKAYLSCLTGCLNSYNQCESKAPEGFSPEFRACLDNQEKCKSECEKAFQEKLLD